ncbi:MAG: hypothetical protein RLZZ399_561 [Verrucomicrobiota bacterium]
MNLAITSLYLPSGSKIGVGYQVHHFANQMVSRGHSVVVFSQSGASPDSRYAVEVIRSPPPWRTFRFAWDLRSVNFQGFDALHAHGDDWFLWGRKRPRHVHTYHGWCLLESVHASRPREKLRMLGLSACEYASTALCDVAVAVSEHTRGMIPLKTCEVIPNGVDLGVFHPGEAKSAAPSILFVGTLEGRKRGRMLLQKFRNDVLARIPEAELWMVCEERVEGPGVRWFGRVSEVVLAELYRKAWVFCLPSSYEGFGIPYVEAMASGTAVVATPNPGAREVTAYGYYGLLAEERDLGAQLAGLILDSSRRKRMESRGLRRAQEFGWDRVCGRYEDLYRGEAAQIHDHQLYKPLGTGE